MGISGPRPIDGSVFDVVPLFGGRGLDVLINLGAHLRYINKDCQQPPLSHEAHMEPLGYERDEDPDSMTRREQMAGEEVICVRARFYCSYQQSGCRLLGISELFQRIDDRPGIPMLENKILMVLQQP